MLSLTNSMNLIPDPRSLERPKQSELDEVPCLKVVIDGFSSSPAALQALAGLMIVQSSGSIPHSVRTRLSLALASALGNDSACERLILEAEGSRIVRDEISANTAGGSHDARCHELIEVACDLAEGTKGFSPTHLLRLQRSGFRDAEIVEMILHVGLAKILSLATSYRGVLPRESAKVS